MEKEILIPTEIHNAIIKLETNYDREFMFYFINLMETCPRLHDMETAGHVPCD
jgi:hypothetical protein